MSKIMGKVFVSFSALLVLLMVASLPLYAAVYGKISGVVTDKKTGEPLPGVNVLIVGTTLGSTTDLEGRYFILNVPPGTYSLKTSFIGYTTITKTDVQVTTDQTTEVNFQLEQTVIEGQTVTVVAERPLIEKTLTQSKTTIGSDELDNTLPVSTVHDIIETAASTFRGYVRGGRKYETKTIVDGVDVSDTYFSGGTGAFGSGDVGHAYQGFRRSELNETTVGDLPSSAVQEMNIYAGTFTAEYPAASAGIINLVTKTGGDKYTGKVFFRFTPSDRWSHFGSNVYWMKDSKGNDVGYFDEKQQLLNSGTVFGKRAAELYTWTEDLAREKYYYDPTDSVGLGRSFEIEGNLSGPLPFLGDKGGFFFTGRFQNLRTTALPFDIDKRFTGTLKMHYDLTKNKRITAFAQINDGGKLFNFVNWKFNPKWAYYMEGAPRYKDLGIISYLKWTHTLSPKTFYEVQLSQSNKTSWIGYPDDNGDGYIDLDEKGDFITFDTMDEYLKYVGGRTKTDTIRDANGQIVDIETYIDKQTLTGYKGNWYNEHPDEVLPLRDPNRSFFYETVDPTSGVNESKANFYKTDGWYRTAYPPPLYSKTTRNVTTLKADLTSQVTYNHQVKTGAQFRMHYVDVNHKQAELGGAGRMYPYSVFHTNIHTFRPKEFAFYLQDRIEYSGMIINIGARVDGYDNDTKRFVNDFHPWDVVKYPSGDLKELRPVRDGRVGWKWFFSPRLGVSHPISDRMAMHYSFGKFVQYPNFATLYTDYNFTNYAASPQITTVWPDQQPIRSTAYEIGLQYSPLEDILVDGTVYYRDVENYSKLNILLTPYAGQGLLYQMTWGNADSRGIELTIEKRPGKWWTGRLTYSYSYIKAAKPRGGAEESQRLNFAAKVDSANFARLPIERGNWYNYREENITVRSTQNALAGGFDRTHRFAATMILFMPYNVQVSAIGNAMSGFKYLPRENIDNDPWFDVSPKLREGDWNFWVNLRLTWEGKIGTLRFRPFAEVRNVTNHKNVLAYNNTPFNEATDQKIYELGRDYKPNTGDEKDPEGYWKVPHDVLGRLLYGPARQFWAGIEIGF